MIISNDPIWWPVININYVYSYVAVALVTVIVYDCALTCGEEVDLIWKQHWSLMTILYLSVRYVGIPVYVMYLTQALPEVPLTDKGCATNYSIFLCATSIFNFMLWVIMFVRLHAMYQRSRKMFIFLIINLLVAIIACGIIISIVISVLSGEEFILSGTYFCDIFGYNEALMVGFIAIQTVWEVFALCLTAWVAVKHFRELRQNSAGSAFGDCFSALIKSHGFYFAGFGASACFTIAQGLSPIMKSSVPFTSITTIAQFIQVYILGPRLILDVREYHAKLAANTETGTGVSTIAFQMHTRVSTSGSEA